MYKFIKLKDQENRFDITEIEMSVDASDLIELLDSFKSFLLASGYSIDGDVIVYKEELDNQEEL